MNRLRHWFQIIRDDFRQCRVWLYAKRKDNIDHGEGGSGIGIGDGFGG